MTNDKNIGVCLLIMMLSFLLIGCHMVYHDKAETFTTMTNVKQQLRPMVRTSRLFVEKHMNTLLTNIKKFRLKMGI